MWRFCDSAAVPSADTLEKAAHDGVTAWAGYLASPYAANAWSDAELSRVLEDIGGLLPVYVAPYPPDRIIAAHPERDAAQALDGLAGIRHAVASDTAHPTRFPVALDIEPAVWSAHPAATADYFEAFVAAIGDAAYVLPYGSPTTLIGLRHHDEHPPAAWCASWLTSTAWPEAIEPPKLGNAWHGRRAWQFHGQTNRYGMGVDLNVADDAFPMLHHYTGPEPKKPAKKTTPAPRTPKTIRATVVVGSTTYSGPLEAAPTKGK